jgi:CRISPR/Cas system-associated protein Cas10 (large subunit of type III CRISPR-Cas system)
MGAELNDCCQECVDEIKNAPANVGTCEWCRTPNVELKNRRDMDEGLAGRVYEVCKSCIDKDNKRIDDELAEDDYWRDYD